MENAREKKVIHQSLANEIRLGIPNKSIFSFTIRLLIQNYKNAISIKVYHKYLRF